MSEIGFLEYWQLQNADGEVLRCESIRGSFPSDKDKVLCVVEATALDAANAEIEGLKRMISRINEHVFPGEVDSIDSLRKLLAERSKVAELEAEIQKLKQDYRCTYEEANEAYRKLDSERERSRRAIEALKRLQEKLEASDEFACLTIISEALEEIT